MNLSGLWDQLVDCICRPPRDYYTIEELAGKQAGRLTLAGQLFKREDLVLVNKKNQKLQCSHYRPEKPLYSTPLPIVVYCHCNSGSRRDAEEALCVLLPQGISVFCLDFAGSGRSEGEWVTLGAHEVDDLECVIKHLRSKFPDSAVALWGRSMGAVTCLLYGHRDPSIAGMVVDSPFARLTELMLELCEEQRIPIPRAFMRVALSMMRRSVKKRAQFSLDDVAPLDLAPKAFIPVLFGHAEKDTFISCGHTKRLHEAYAGDKEMVIFDGDHNTVRPQHFYSSVLMFLHAALRCSQPSLPPPRAITPRPIHPKRDTGPLPCRAPSVRRGMVDVDPAEFLVGQAPERNQPAPWDRAGADETFKQLHSTLSWEHMRRGQAGSQPPSTATTPPRHSRNSSLSAAAGGRLAMEQPATSSATAADRQPSASAPTDGRLAMEPVGHHRDDSAADRKLHPPGVSSSEGSAWLRGDDRDRRPPAHDYDYDDEDAMLAHVLEMSMKEAQIAQRNSVVATAHAGQEAASAHRVHVPESMQRLNSEDADELMLVEAIQASLQLQAEKQQQHSAPPASTADVAPPSQHAPDHSYDPYAPGAGANVHRPSSAGNPPASSPFLAAASQDRRDVLSGTAVVSEAMLGLSRSYHQGAAADSAHSAPLQHRQDSSTGGRSLPTASHAPSHSGDSSVYSTPRGSTTHETTEVVIPSPPPLWGGSSPMFLRAQEASTSQAPTHDSARARDSARDSAHPGRCDESSGAANGEAHLPITASYRAPPINPGPVRVSSPPAVMPISFPQLLGRPPISQAPLQLPSHSSPTPPQQPEPARGSSKPARELKLGSLEASVPSHSQSHTDLRRSSSPPHEQTKRSSWRGLNFLRSRSSDSDVPGTSSAHNHQSKRSHHSPSNSVTNLSSDDRAASDGFRLAPRVGPREAPHDQVPSDGFRLAPRIKVAEQQRVRRSDRR